MSMTSDGVSSSVSTGFAIICPSASMIKPLTRATVKLVCSASLTLSLFPEPIKPASMTFEPIERPVNSVTITLMTGAFAPTAAMA